MHGRTRSRRVPTSPSRGRASCASWRQGSRSAAGRPGASPILRRADLVGVSHHDVPAETPLSELYGFLGPRADLLITQGADGGLLIRLGPDGPVESLRYLPTATDGESDPTGAGDTFLAALQASILRPAVVGRNRTRHRLDLRFAAAAGSLVVEGPGLGGVPDRAPSSSAGRANGSAAR